MNATIETNGRTYAGKLLEIPSSTDALRVVANTGDDGAAIQAAIDRAWQLIRETYKAFKPRPGVAYPNNEAGPEVWPRSEYAASAPVLLPSCPMEVDRLIFLPACIPLLGNGFGNVFDGSKIHFRDGGGLVVLGDMDAEFGRVLAHGRTIAGIYFAGKSNHLLQLRGAIDNLRIQNCHFNGGVSDFRWSSIFCMLSPIRRDAGGYGTLITDGAHLKDIVISGNQIEGGYFGIYLNHPFGCDITGNKFYYSDVGVGLRSSKGCIVSGNQFRKHVYAGLVDVHDGCHLENNAVQEAKRGFWVEGVHDDRLGDHMGTLNGQRSHPEMYTLDGGGKMGIPEAAAGLKAGVSFWSQM